VSGIHRSRRERVELDLVSDGQLYQQRRLARRLVSPNPGDRGNAASQWRINWRILAKRYGGGLDPALHYPQVRFRHRLEEVTALVEAKRRYTGLDQVAMALGHIAMRRWRESIQLDLVSDGQLDHAGPLHLQRHL
jgi:hypothetical protein